MKQGIDIIKKECVAVIKSCIRQEITACGFKIKDFFILISGPKMKQKNSQKRYFKTRAKALIRRNKAFPK